MPVVCNRGFAAPRLPLLPLLLLLLVSATLSASAEFRCTALSARLRSPVILLSIRGGGGDDVEEEEDADAEEEDGGEEDAGDDETEEVAASIDSVKARTRKTVSLSSGVLSFKSLLKSLYNLLRPLFSTSPKPVRRASSSSSSSSGGGGGKAKTGNSAATLEHLEKSFKTGDSNARVQKELRAFVASPPDGCKLSVGANIRSWVVTLEGAEGTIYAGEKYKLKLVFPKDYPSKPPSVYFLKPTPRHQHVYSNGDICLNLLGRDWRPTMTAQALVVSILSMLSSAKEKKIPQDNALHSDNAPGQQQEGWMYHDDKC